MASARTVDDEVALKGKQLKVRSITVGDFVVAISGRLLRIATIKDELWLSNCVTDPDAIISALKTAKPTADIFVFSQRLPDTQPRYTFKLEYDNLAAIPISTYEHWWDNQIKRSARKAVRKAEKSGLVTRIVEFDDALVKGIIAIYNETPVRQGRRFWHYGKDFAIVKKENATYLDRCDFIGTFRGDELVGFLKMVYVGSYAAIMQVLSLIGQRENAPTNTLVAKAVEVCAAKGISHFVYSNFSYGKKGEDGLSEFKRNNGFLKIDIPKYSVPLTLKGRVALALGLHRPLTDLLPKWLVIALLRLRTKWHAITGQSGS